MERILVVSLAHEVEEKKCSSKESEENCLKLRGKWQRMKQLKERMKQTKMKKQMENEQKTQEPTKKQ